MAIDQLPPAPQPNDTPQQFNTKASAFVAALANWTNQVNQIETNFDALADSAASSATTASAKASEASASSSEALVSKNSAAASQSLAQNSATQAGLSANSASASSTTASIKAAEASQSALEASQSAVISISNASQSESHAQEANLSASLASTKAAEASLSADSAASSAFNSGASASSATISAQNAADSASFAQNYASNASLSAISAESSATDALNKSIEASASAASAAQSESNAIAAAQAASQIVFESSPVFSVSGKTGIVILGKEDVGLSEVDNTSDANKPISIAQQAALNGKENIGAADLAVAAHSGASDPHPQYQIELVSGTNIKTINGQSILGAGNIEIQGGVGVALSGDVNIYATQSKIYTITNYNVFSTYFVQVSAGSVSISGDQITFTAPATAQTVTLSVTMDTSATVFSLVVQGAGVTTPTNSSPSNGATDQAGTVMLTSSAFGWYGLSDTHLNSDWQLATDSGFTSIVQSASADAVNKISWTVSGLSTSQTYYWRVRHRGTNNGVSAWSTGTSFITKSTFGGLIGTQGGQGFGVGEYAGTLPSGFSAMTGTSDKASANYGNYQYNDGSIMVFVPRFYYRIGNASSPRYATYGVNAIDIVGIDAFATEAAANAAGYAMHRAFKDGGSDKSGFFIDKYLASKNGTTSCKSVQNGVPISLTTSTNFTRSQGMTTGEGSCTGVLADAVLLARSRGVGTFNVASVFMYSALALLSLAHAQASTNTTYCSWYDTTNNFPKGCNNGSLADTNDTGVTFTTAGDTGAAAKPLTGSGNPFAKTTHNGQSCGVTDVNGAMWQVMLGITSAGASATDTTVQANGSSYVLNPAVALASLTHGWNGTNDAWGNAANLANKYDLVAGLFPWGATTGWTYFGNGSNQVFSGATSGFRWQRAACGIQDETSGTSVAGTNQFGNDGCYQYNTANLFALSAGHWNYAANAGVFHRTWYDVRSNGNLSVGFRAGAYGS